MNICSDYFENTKQQVYCCSPWQVECYFEAYKEEFPGGDRFAIVKVGEVIYFYIADATGHGYYAAEFWKKHGEYFDENWQQFIHKPFSRDALYQFTLEFNTRLTVEKDYGAQLCIAIGMIHGETVSFANFGYGTHLLIRQNGNAWKAKSEQELFGLKLGWAQSEMWKRIPRAFVYQTIDNVDRVVLMTDCFLEDDFRDPSNTLKSIEAMNTHICALEFSQVRPYFFNTFSYSEDDASLVVIERM